MFDTPLRCRAGPWNAADYRRGGAGRAAQSSQQRGGDHPVERRPAHAKLDEVLCRRRRRSRFCRQPGSTS